jgi:protein-S-isoprenylcysteine O-methyltransferase Ste14
MDLKLPPVALALIAILLMLLADHILPALAFELSLAPLLASGLLLLGAIPAVLGVIAFRKAATTVDPRYPQKATQLVSRGIYRFTRNPMYLGMALGLTGCAVFLRNWSCFAVLPLFMVYLSRFQIQPEERHMRNLFGAAFVDYSARVRRWL